MVWRAKRDQEWTVSISALQFDKVIDRRSLSVQIPPVISSRITASRTCSNCRTSDRVVCSRPMKRTHTVGASPSHFVPHPDDTNVVTATECLDYAPHADLTTISSWNTPRDFATLRTCMIATSNTRTHSPFPVS
jgi:hypothetical protein